VETPHRHVETPHRHVETPHRHVETPHRHVEMRHKTNAVRQNYAGFSANGVEMEQALHSQLLELAAFKTKAQENEK
jgi:hypothetical protein